MKNVPYEVSFLVTGSIIAPERITLLEVLHEETREIVVLNHEREEEIILRVAQNLESEDFLAEEEEDDFFCSADRAGHYDGEILFPHTNGVDEAHSLMEFQDTVKFHNKMDFKDEEDMQYQDIRDPHL